MCWYFCCVFRAFRVCGWWVVGVTGLRRWHCGDFSHHLCMLNMACMATLFLCFFLNFSSAPWGCKTQLQDGAPMILKARAGCQMRMGQNLSGWWFGTWLIFFHHIGNVIIPTDFHSIIFQRGWLKPPTSNRICHGRLGNVIIQPPCT